MKINMDAVYGVNGILSEKRHIPKRINTRQKGLAYERKVVDYLKSENYFVVRGTVSECGKLMYSGFPDIIAVGNNSEVLFIECKSSGYLSKREKALMLQFKSQYGITPYLSYPRYGVYSTKKGNIILKEIA